MDETIINVNMKQIDIVKKKNEDIVTMEILQQVANQVDPMIQFTFDTPILNPDLTMPILDLKVRIGQDGTIYHQFYEKPTKNTRVIAANSALSFHSKKNIMVQECIRRLRNIKQESRTKMILYLSSWKD